MKILICVFLVLMNLLGYELMAMDKRRARAGRWRIPEASLFGVALLGGSVGCILGMYVFRHKTRHIAFVIGMPLILIAQLAAAYFFFLR